ncbi:hypothetical protein HK104_006822 [Borealophlyctis nickersoniae]|nr:hypothetical protein HK104_006822 [Borealophlyctis nickersoniae]
MQDYRLPPQAPMYPYPHQQEEVQRGPGKGERSDVQFFCLQPGCGKVFTRKYKLTSHQISHSKGHGTVAGLLPGMPPPNLAPADHMAMPRVPTGLEEAAAASLAAMAALARLPPNAPLMETGHGTT